MRCASSPSRSTAPTRTRSTTTGASSGLDEPDRDGHRPLSRREVSALGVHLDDEGNGIAVVYLPIADGGLDPHRCRAELELSRSKATSRAGRARPLDSSKRRCPGVSGESRERGGGLPPRDRLGARRRLSLAFCTHQGFSSSRPSRGLHASIGRALASPRHAPNPYGHARKSPDFRNNKLVQGTEGDLVDDLLNGCVASRPEPAYWTASGRRTSSRPSTMRWPRSTPETREVRIVA